jgi:uncharacterized protein (DUF2141 family)
MLTGFSSEKTVSLTVTVHGIENDKGSILLALFDNARDFSKKKVRQHKGSVVAKFPTVTYIFKDIPIGIYAVAIYHDKNNNMKLDTKLLGIPVEGYGFSNNVRGVFGSPKFIKASIELVRNKEIVIQMKY